MKTFDELLAMSEDELEQYRKEESERIIESADESQRAKLRGLQWKCDMLSNKESTNPTSKMVQTQLMMWESFGELKDALEGNISKDIKKSATVTDISKRNKGEDEDV